MSAGEEWEMDERSRIYVAGHRGLAGGAIMRRLKRDGCTNLIARSRAELDLCDRRAVDAFFDAERPEYVFLAAAKVGGILANSTQPAEFIYSNLAIEINVIDSAYRHGVRKLAFLGSSCIYPKFAPQPIREECLLTGELEPTNEPYAVAKIAGIKMAQAYAQQYGFRAISLTPTNLYGPGDHFDPRNSHVLPGLLRRFHEGKLAGAHEVVMWGTGTPRRELLHVDDLADAAVFLMREYDSPDIVNVGAGEDISIRELGELVKRITGFEGEIRFDPSKPDGTPRKLLDAGRLNGLGWKAQIPLEQGVRETYDWYLQNVAERSPAAITART